MYESGFKMNFLDALEKIYTNSSSKLGETLCMFIDTDYKMNGFINVFFYSPEETPIEFEALHLEINYMCITKNHYSTTKFLHFLQKKEYEANWKVIKIKDLFNYFNIKTFFG